MRVSNHAFAFFAGLALIACVAGSDDQSGSPATLLHGEWVVEDIAARGVSDYARTTIVFGQNGRLSGDTSCNRYFADYQADKTNLHIENAGATKRACAPAVMDQENRFLSVLNAVANYQIVDTGALELSTPVGTTITARQASASLPQTTYKCPDGALLEVLYPTTGTARLFYQGRSIEMTSVISASGARYVGGDWQWWTKGKTEGTLSPLAEGETIVSARGMTCIAS